MDKRKRLKERMKTKNNRAYFLIFILIFSLVIMSCICGNSLSQSSPTQQEGFDSYFTSTEEKFEASSTTPTEVIATKTITPSKTNVPTITAVDPSKMIAKNYLGTVDSGGVEVEILRILIAEKTVVNQDFSDEIFLDKYVVAQFTFRIQNNTEEVISVFVGHALIAVNSEQIDLFDYMWDFYDFGDSISGDFLPGVSSIGGVWCGIKNYSVQEINRIIVTILAPAGPGMKRLGPNYFFDIEVNDWGYEEPPEKW